MRGMLQDTSPTMKAGIHTVIPRPSVLVILIAIVAGIALLNALIGSVILDRFVTRMFIDMTLVVSLQIFMGNSGILWFPHLGFAGIGAYASVIFSMSPLQKMMSLPQLYPFLADVHLSFVVALLLGALVVAVLVAIISLPLMRLHDYPAVIAGFALLVVIHVVLTHWRELTNGPQTLFGVDRYTYAPTAALWAGIAIVIAYLFKESRVGLQLRASRDGRTAAASAGVNVVLVRWVSVIVSAFVGAIGGGLYAHYITSFTPNAFYLQETFVVLSMIVIGGPATVSGAVVGTLVVTVLLQGLRWIENSEMLASTVSGGLAGISNIALAVILIAILVLRPGGLLARDELSLDGLRHVLGRRKLQREEPPPSA